MNSLLLISCAAHAAKAAGHGRHFFPVFSPNLFDVIITAIICVTIGVVVISALVTFYQWKKSVRLAEEKARQEKRKWDVQDNERKTIAELSDKIITKLNGKENVSLTTWKAYVCELNKYIATLETNENKET